MKTITTFLTIALCISSQLYAQNERSNFFGGSIKHGEEIDLYNGKQDVFSAALGIGHMVSEKTAVGVGLTFMELEYSRSSKTQIVGVSPFLRFYKNITPAFKFITEPSVTATFYLPDNDDDKIMGYGAGLNFGFLYFLTEKWSVEFNIGGLNFYTIPDFDDQSLNLDLSILSPKVGLLYYF
jgi:hypothetical protein